MIPAFERAKTVDDLDRAAYHHHHHHHHYYYHYYWNRSVS
jgi:hypothetical protein